MFLWGLDESVCFLDLVECLTSSRMSDPNARFVSALRKLNIPLDDYENHQDFGLESFAFCERGWVMESDKH